MGTRRKNCSEFFGQFSLKKGKVFEHFRLKKGRYFYLFGVRKRELNLGFKSNRV